MFAFFKVCSECNEPVDTFNLISYVGFNFGLDGHMFSTKESAKSAWVSFIEALPKSKDTTRGGYWTAGFKCVSDEVEYLNRSIKLMEVNFTALEA